jgi:hypothetical protein
VLIRLGEDAEAGVLVEFSASETVGSAGLSLENAFLTEDIGFHGCSCVTSGGDCC